MLKISPCSTAEAAIIFARNLMVELFFSTANIELEISHKATRFTGLLRLYVFTNIFS